MSDYLQAPYTPVPVDALLMAFPAGIAHLMPPEDEIPEQFEKRAHWEKLQSDWFFYGIVRESLKLVLRDGIDGETAFRHLSCVQGSYEFKHQYKVAAFAFLCSTWFEDGEWEHQPRMPMP